MNSKQGITHSPATAEVSPVPFREGPVVIMLGFAIILVVMNTMMFNLALPQISLDFELSSVSSSWVVTGYSIVFAIFSIIYTRLSDYVPLRLLCLIALISLGSASVLGYFSHHFVLLMIARLIQASGASAIASLPIILLTRYIPVQRRGRAIAIVMSAGSLGLGLGPIIGGFITELWGWNGLFAVTGLSLLLIPFFIILLPKEAPQPGSFDYSGAVLIGIGSTALLLFISMRSLPLLAVSAIALLLFWLRIRKAELPFIQPELFGNRRYMLLIGLGIFGFVVHFCSLFLLPQMLAHLFQLSPGRSGLILFPGAMLSMLAAGLIGRRIDRLGNIRMFRLSPWLIVAAAMLFALFAASSIYAIMFIYIVLILGFSALSASVSNEISQTLPNEQMGAGMGLFQLLQVFSGASSVAISGSMLAIQRHLPLSAGYANLYWGLTGIALISYLLGLGYIKAKNSASTAATVRSALRNQPQE